MPSTRTRSPSILAVIAGALACATTWAGAQATPIERGRYLVTTILACGNCHTPKDADGRPIAAKELAGADGKPDAAFTKLYEALQETEPTL